MGKRGGTTVTYSDVELCRPVLLLLVPVRRYGPEDGISAPTAVPGPIP